MAHKQTESLPREVLEGMLDDFAKNWLAHDGLWFQAVEKACGMEKAIELDTEAWKYFSRIEATRIMARHGIKEKNGLDALKKALKYRLYARLNQQAVLKETENSFEFGMTHCRVQAARKRKGLAPFPCKSVGIVEYTEFAKTIDPKIHIQCMHCPPDEVSDECWCRWRFTLD